MHRFAMDMPVEERHDFNLLMADMSRPTRRVRDKTAVSPTISTTGMDVTGSVPIGCHRHDASAK
jgi:hypothetical protein